MKTPEMLNLIPAIREVEAQIRNIEADFKVKLKPYQESLVALRKINQACERCEGLGKILRSRSYAEDDRPDPNDPTDWNICPVCHGTGRATVEEK